MFTHPKRVLAIVILLATIGFSFGYFSRYPDLNRKAMAAESAIGGRHDLDVADAQDPRLRPDVEEDRLHHGQLVQRQQEGHGVRCGRLPRCCPR